MAATIKDIAKRAGVSYQAVSFALNDTGRISEEMKDKIKLTAEELNYVPNAAAKNMRLKKTQTLGAIFPCIYDNEFFAGIYRGMEDVLLEWDYNILLCNSAYKIDREAAYLRLLQEKRVDGIILSHCGGFHKEYENGNLIKAILVQRDIPFILVDTYLEDIETDYVGSDNVTGAYNLVKHLIKLGHKKIAYIAAPRYYSTIQERFRGYRRALEEYSIPFDESLVKWMSEEEQADYWTKELIRNNKPTAIFVCNDGHAMYSIKAAQEEGLKVPEDLAVVGYDDLKGALYSSVPLTTVRQRLHDIGENVAKIFLDRVNGKEIKGAREVLVPTELIIRESCGAKLVKNK